MGETPLGSLEDLATLTPGELRRLLPELLAWHMVGVEALCLARGRELVARWPETDVVSLLEHLRTAGRDGSLRPAHEPCREVVRSMFDVLIESREVVGLSHLREAMQRGRTIVACNHLSYFDTGATDRLLVDAGAAELADRLVALAGPKVHQTLFRRVNAATLNTITVPQGSRFQADDEPALPLRALAQRTKQSIAAAQAALDAGRVLLAYPEGSRTRDGRLQSLLRGMTHYLRPGDRLVPLAIVGTDRCMPVGSARVVPGPITLTFGPSLEVGDQSLERLFGALRALLPARHQPAATTPAVE